jgi:hypothetical protein
LSGNDALVPLVLVAITQKGFHENDPLLAPLLFVCVAVKEPLLKVTQLVVPLLVPHIGLVPAWACGVGPSNRQPPTTAATAVAEPMVVSIPLAMSMRPSSVPRFAQKCPFALAGRD